MDQIQPVFVFLLAVAGISAWRISRTLLRIKWLRIEAAIVDCEDTSTVSSTPEGVVGPRKANRCRVRYLVRGTPRTGYVYDVDQAAEHVTILVNPASPDEIFKRQGNLAADTFVFLLCLATIAVLILRSCTG